MKLRVIMWTVAFLLPSTARGLPTLLPSVVPEETEPARRTFFPSQSSVVASVSLSLSSSSSSESSSSEGFTDFIAVSGTVSITQSLGTGPPRRRRDLKPAEPHSPESAMSGVQNTAHVHPEAGDAAVIKSSAASIRHQRRKRKNRRSKKRLAARKRRRLRRKCLKNRKRLRNRRRCLRSRKSGRRDRKKKRNPGKRGRKRRRLAAGENSPNSTAREETVHQKPVTPAPVDRGNLQPSQIASLFGKASPLENLKDKPSSHVPLEQIVSGFDSRQALSKDTFKSRHNHKRKNS